MKRIYTLLCVWAVAFVCLLWLAPSFGAESEEDLTRSYVGFSMSRSLDEFAYYYAGLEAYLAYGIWNQWQIEGLGGISHGFTKYKDNKENYFFEDTLLAVHNPKLAEIKDIGVSIPLRFGLLLPTSIVSRNASLRIGAFAESGADKKVGPVSLAYRLRAIGYDHKFKSANSAGTKKNPYFSLRNRIIIGVPVVSSLSLQSLFELHSYWNHGGRQQTSYRIYGGPQYQISKPLQVYSAVQVADRVRTLNGFLDDETVKVELGLRYSF